VTKVGNFISHRAPRVGNIWDLQTEEFGIRNTMHQGGLQIGSSTVYSNGIVKNAAAQLCNCDT
jgi:hypothetical protein